jgi:hypothetical protein
MHALFSTHNFVCIFSISNYYFPSFFRTLQHLIDADHLEISFSLFFCLSLLVHLFLILATIFLGECVE